MNKETQDKWAEILFPILFKGLMLWGVFALLDWFIKVHTNIRFF
jgi:hypothetical protein